MASDLSKHDPYRGMESGKDDIRPEFLGGVDDNAGVQGVFRRGEGTGVDRVDKRAARVERKAAKRAEKEAAATELEGAEGEEVLDNDEVFDIGDGRYLIVEGQGGSSKSFFQF